MRFQCSHCNSIVAIDDSECGNPVGCGNCGGVTTVPESRFSPGAVINDFIIQRVIGNGGMGQVYLAHQQSLDRPVALKVLMEEFSRNSEFIVDFVKEARAAARLNHPNIVQSYAVGEEDGVYFFAMEYVEGETLTDMLHREGIMGLEQAVNIIQQISEALDFAWKNQQLVHRDVKPDNIMLTPRGVAKLADLGLARAASELADELQQDEVMGTPQYICPEQLLGQPMDTRGDIYSLGATFYQMVTGNFPFEGKSAAEIARKHLQETLVPPHEINKELPEAVSWIICKMMAKKAENRYTDGAALATDLGLILRGEAPDGFEGEKPGKKALKSAAKPAPAAVTTDADDEAEEETGAEAPEAAAPSSSSGPKLKKKGGKTMLKLGKRGKKKLRTGTPTELGGGTAAASEADDAAGALEEGAEEDGEAIDVTTQVPGLAGPRKKSKAPLIIGALAFVALLAVGGYFGLSYMSQLNALPTTTEEAISYYFSTETTQAAEQEAYEKIAPYIGQLEEHRGDVETLRRVSALAANFIREYPTSLFVKPADEVDYADTFNLSAAMAQRVAPLAEPVAGTIPQMLADYEEALVRALRRQAHAEELETIAARESEADQEAAWEQAATMAEAYAKKRARELNQALRGFTNAITARERRFAAEKQEVRVAVFTLTVDSRFTEAVSTARGIMRERKGYPDPIETAAQFLLRDPEAEVAKLEIRRISNATATDRDRVGRLINQAIIGQKVNDIRKEIERQPAAEKALIQARERWFQDLLGSIEKAGSYHRLVAGSGDKLKNERIRVDIPKRASQELRIGMITRDTIMVNVVEITTGGNYETKRTVEFPLAELPLRAFIDYAEKSWGPQDPEEYQLLLATFIYYKMGFDNAKRLLEQSNDNTAAFLLEELPEAQKLQRRVQLIQLVQNVRQMINSEQQENARKYALAIKKRYGSDAEFAHIEADLEALVGDLPDADPEPEPEAAE